MAEQRLVGKAVSGGHAAGPLAIVSNVAVGSRHGGDARAEADALRNAVLAGIEQLSELAAHAEADGAEIIAFQIAMLEDDALAAPAFVAIEGGASAHEAWRSALDREVAGYEAAQDEYFRARASDLEDIRDRVLDTLSGAVAQAPAPAGAILIGEDLTPSRFLSTDWTRGGGIALTRGSASSHVATLARARGVPMIVGVPIDLSGVGAVSEAWIDGESAILWLDPAPATRKTLAALEGTAAKLRAEADELRLRPAVTADGQAIAIHVNIADLDETEHIDIAGFDGVGLVRTEFLFGRGARLPNEQEQYLAYRRLAEWARGKPVTIRTLDAGADKPIPGLTLAHENNPFLGVRGIRLSLARPEVFRTQLRALCRAAAHGDIEIMLPMVSIPAELERARGLLHEELAGLRAAGVACREPKLGIMVEVPAAAIAIERFGADFYSIGSNDLTQYVMAAARDCEAVAELNDPVDPAMLRLIGQVATHAVATGRKASLCGDAGAEPKFVAALLRAGLRALSIAPPALGRVKAAIAQVDLSRSAS
ncbi:MAG: phosphoenolpyruvate--protein phosphotransferase [Roseiarcus sp.]|jgi:phosphotransferase system enzyme I (PtsI)